jgi:hypothetical protein
MNTTFASFHDAILNASATAINNYVLPSICNWLLTNKNITVTPAELSNALQLPAPSRNIIVGTASPIANVAVPATGGRKKANTKTAEPVAPGQGCIRIMKNGPPENRGQPCNKVRMDGKMYCKVCNYLKSGGGESKTAVVKAPAGLTEPTTNIAPPAEEDNEVQAEELPKFPGYYLDKVCRLMFKIHDNEKWIFYAKLSEDSSKILRFNETDKLYATNKGMIEPTKEDENREFELLSNMLAPKTNGIYNLTATMAPVNVIINPIPQATFNPIPQATFNPQGFGVPNGNLAVNYGVPNMGVYNPQAQFAPINTITPIANIAPISF